MAYVSNEIKNLINAMTNNASFFTTKIVKLYTEAEVQNIIKQIKFELANTLLTDEDADALYLLQLTLTNVNF